MRLFSMRTALCVALLSAGGAAWCFHQAERLRAEADWLLARGKAQAIEYAQSFDEAMATQELETFAQRRAMLERAHQWQRGQVLGVVLAVGSALCAWMVHLLRRLTEQLTEASAGLEPPPGEPAPLRSPRR